MIHPASSDRDRVGPYVLVKAIGAGGSARVDLARIEGAYGFQRHVVIKRPLEHLRSDLRAAESIRREARLGARLRHPNLIEILDAGVHDGYDYVVLDYVHGGSLRTLMESDEAARVRDVPLEVALAIVRDVARGLHEAHELRDERGSPLGLVHRDVSPGNVLVGLDGAVKLADFGIAKETRVATLSGSMHGTVTYMAPEQCRGHAFDRRADVFSLGVILYELVTGMRLFWADNDVASLHRVLAGTITRPRKIRPTIAPELEEIIMTAVAADQDRRLPTARALADALEAYATEAGQILAARWIARWAHDLLGPRDAPWIGTDTVIDAVPEQPASLVALISSNDGAPGEELAPTFGPTDATAFEDGTTDRARPAPRGSRRRTVLGGVLAAGVAAGVIAAVVASSGDRAAPTTQPVPAAVDNAPSPTTEHDTPSPATAHETQVTAPSPPAVDDAGSAGTDVAPSSPTASSEPTPPSEPTTPSRTRRRVQRAETAKAAAQSGSAAGSAATKSTPAKVEWDPTMLLPTDPANPKKR